MVDYKKFLPEKSTRTRENIEWVIFYSFNAPDDVSPRVLAVGDSINYQYKDHLRDILADKANVTSWASSKCVTDVTFLKDFDYVLEYNRYDLITFNNGIHYLTVPTSYPEWENAYRQAIRFAQTKLPQVPIALVLCTPVNNEEKNAVVKDLNKITLRIAADFGLPVIDLYSLLDKLDREEYWNDEFHFKEPAQIIMAQTLADYVTDALKNIINGELSQQSTLTGPSGAIK